MIPCSYQVVKSAHCCSWLATLGVTYIEFMGLASFPGLGMRLEWDKCWNRLINFVEDLLPTKFSYPRNSKFTKLKYHKNFQLTIQYTKSLPKNKKLSIPKANHPFHTHVGVMTVPRVIADSSPDPTVLYLHPSLVGSGATTQTNGEF